MDARQRPGKQHIPRPHWISPTKANSIFNLDISTRRAGKGSGSQRREQPDRQCLLHLTLLSLKTDALYHTSDDHGQRRSCTLTPNHQPCGIFTVLEAEAEAVGSEEVDPERGQEAVLRQAIEGGTRTGAMLCRSQQIPVRRS